MRYHCVICKKEKEGRFTRQKGASARGSFPHMPFWACFTCLPLGQGRDETETDVAKAISKKTEAVAAATASLGVAVGSTAPTAAPRQELTKAKTDILVLMPTLTTEVAELTITDAASYEYADTLLGRISTIQKKWAPFWARMKEKVIDPIRSGLEELYEINREVERPVAQLEEKVKAKMKAYKQLELRIAQEAQRLKQAEVDRLAREAEEKARQAAEAVTPQVRGRLEKASQKLQEQSIAVSQQEVAEPVKGSSSGTRAPKVPTVKDLNAFLLGITKGEVPEDCIQVVATKLKAYYKEDPEAVASFPGVVIEDDIVVVKR